MRRRRRLRVRRRMSMVVCEEEEEDAEEEDEVKVCARAGRLKTERTKLGVEMKEPQQPAAGMTT